MNVSICMYGYTWIYVRTNVCKCEFVCTLNQVCINTIYILTYIRVRDVRHNSYFTFIQTVVPGTVSLNVCIGVGIRVCMCTYGFVRCLYVLVHVDVYTLVYMCTHIDTYYICRG